MSKHQKQGHIYERAIKSFESMTTFEKTVTVIGSIEPITSIPQVLLVYELQSADELSLFTWSFGVFATSLWLIYAISRKSWPLITSSILWLAADIPIVVAILLFD